MMGVAQRWVRASVVGLCTLAAASAALGAELKLSDNDRLFRNFTREAAVVDQGQVRVEVRGFHSEELSDDHDRNNPGRCQRSLAGNCARLNALGQRIKGVEQVSSGVIDLLVSYGFAKNAEVGAILPGYIETLRRDDGTSETAEDIGDMTLYGKFKYEVLTDFSIGGGLELTPPTGPDDKIITVRSATDPSDKRGTASGFGTGALGINPFVSARYTYGRLGAETHLGYNFYSSDSVERVFNWSAAALIRVTDMFTFRTEFSGRVWDQFGTRWVDVVCLPGIDVRLSDNFVVRPTGMANVSETAMDWGVGLGIAATL